MHFVVHALDKSDALPLRLAVIEEHRAHLDMAPAQHGITVLLSGPLMSDDGNAMQGSFLLLDAPDRTALDALLAKDPLYIAGVWKNVDVHAVHIRQNNLTKPVESDR